MTQKRLKYRENLLADISSDLKKFSSNPRLEDITVSFIASDGSKVWTGGLVGALDCISNDLWFNEDGDFSEAIVARAGVD